MKKYLYTHTLSCHASLKIDGKHTSVSMHNGESYLLPTDNSFVQSLMAQGKLVEVQEPVKKDKEKAEVKETSGNKPQTSNNQNNS